ncbi:NAD(P)/FAD-dependent oxidoreductase [Pelotomaculum propionicicum]|uniref:NAD(P)/FAD-dependent oxidoreductase n=1 Tax=Pelotomaculum propionicicum TaxID=258475 RepID=UPI003B814B44
MKYDVIIAGAGPAGATAALECARSGLSAVIIEKEQLPRYKPCAGGVTAAAANMLWCPIPEKIVQAKCRSFKAFYGEKSIHVDTEENFMFVVSRDKFDYWLVKAAVHSGAVLRQGEEATSFDIGPDGVTVRTGTDVYTGKLLIGADGVNSKIAKIIRGPFRRNDLAICLCTECDDTEHNYNREQIEIHYGPLPMTYSWVFPKKDYLSVGMGGWCAEAEGMKAVFNNFLEKKGLKKQDVRSYTVPLGGIGRITVADRVLLAGDAAGFADPLTGEGIRYAIASGRLAAKTAASVILEGLDINLHNLLIYKKSCIDEFGDDLKAAMSVARLFQKLPDFLFGMYFSSQEPFEKSLEILQGRIGYQDYYHWFLPQVPGMLLKKTSAVLKD